VSRELIFTATYNEAANIGPWIRGVVTARPNADILIVDDSSPDGTGAVVAKLAVEFPQITLHSRPGKSGLSSAHIHAMQYALDNNYDTLVTMDADGSHQPSQIPAVLGGLGIADFCIGTRTRGGATRQLYPAGSSVMGPMSPRAYYCQWESVNIQLPSEHLIRFPCVPC